MFVMVVMYSGYRLSRPVYPHTTISKGSIIIIIIVCIIVVINIIIVIVIVIINNNIIITPLLTSSSYSLSISLLTISNIQVFRRWVMVCRYPSRQESVSLITSFPFHTEYHHHHLMIMIIIKLIVIMIIFMIIIVIPTGVSQSDNLISVGDRDTPVTR